MGQRNSKRFVPRAIALEQCGVGLCLQLALQLCPLLTLQFGPLTYQPIECVVISSNQSALWSCLPRVTSQLGEGSSMSVVWVLFVSLSWSCGGLALCTKQSWSVFPNGFLENFTEVWSLFETFLGQRICSYVGRLESLGQGWSSKKDSVNKNVRWLWGGTSEPQPPYFRAFEVRCYLQFFQRLFNIRIRVMVQISSS